MAKKPIGQKRILQITNDIAEDMCTAGIDDLKQTVTYWRDQFELCNRQKVELRMTLVEALTKLIKETL